MNGIELVKNKVIIDLVELKDTAISDIINHLKGIVYNNNVDVFYILANKYDNDVYEFYFIKKFIETIKNNFNIFLMLKTKYFPNTKFFDSVFALGVDALNLSIEEADKKTEQFSGIINYVTNLWPSGTILTDIAVASCSDDEIKDSIDYYTKLKVIPRLVKEEGCEPNSSSACLRDFVLDNLKKNCISLKWVVNFELCGVIQQGGEKGRSKRKLAGKFALEWASLRRRLMVKEVQNSFDSASL